MTDIESKGAALAALTFVDHLARTLVHKGLTHEDRTMTVANAVTFLERSGSPEAKAAARTLKAFWDEGW